MVGDCVQLTKGVFKGSSWTIVAVNNDGTFDLKQSETLLRGVRGSYLQSC